MSFFSILRLFALTSVAATSVIATTCEVAGGTSDDGPAIKTALANCNNGGTVVLDKTYTIATVLETTDLKNVAIQLSGTINLSPGTKLRISNPGYGTNLYLQNVEISYWKASGVELIYQSAYTAWTIGGSGIHIYGGGTFNGSGDSEYPQTSQEF